MNRLFRVCQMVKDDDFLQFVLILAHLFLILWQGNGSNEVWRWFYYYCCWFFFICGIQTGFVMMEKPTKMLFYNTIDCTLYIIGFSALNVVWFVSSNQRKNQIIFFNTTIQTASVQLIESNFLVRCIYNFILYTWLYHLIQFCIQFELTLEFHSFWSNDWFTNKSQVLKIIDHWAINCTSRMANELR